MDCIVEDDAGVFPIEIKMSQTFNETFLKNLITWNALRSSKKDAAFKSAVIYGGNQEMRYKATIVKSICSF